MTRGRRGTDGAPGGRSWHPGEYGQQDEDYLGEGGHQRPSEPSGPPWETSAWQADSGWGQPGPPEPDWQAHPSGPLPTGRPSDPHPSGPLPPLPGAEPGWPDEASGTWASDPLAGEHYPAGGHAAGSRSGGYPEDRYSGGYPPGEYPTGEYPAGGQETGGYPAGEYDGYPEPGRGGYPAGNYASGGYPADDYASGGYPAAGHAGRRFGDPDRDRDYAAGERPGEDEPGYDDAAGPYRDDHGAPGYSGGDPGNHPGYPDRGGWYSDVDERPLWSDDDEADSGFLPGLTGDDLGGQRGGRRPAAPPGRAGKPKRGGMRRIMPRVFLAVLLLAVLAGAGAAYHVYRTYISPPDYSGSGSGSVVVHVLPGDTATAVGLLLQQKGVVASARAFANAAKASPQGNGLEPGYYRLHRHMKASLAFAMLLKPSSRVTFKVLIPEGWRLSQIIAALGKATGDPAGYQKAIKDTAALGLPVYAKGNPEGFLFPATYTIQPGTPPVQVLRSMVQRFTQEAVSVNLPAVARHDQLSEHDVIVVASLIQAEGGRVQDFPKIARVIYNRLNSGMQLQLDSTVMYALHRYGIMASSQQLNVSSPYNTYRHTGLPPGPIDSPGDAAIKAALHPAAGSWLYFVTVDPKTGLTKFTSDPTVFAQLRAQLQQNLAHGR